MENGGKDREKEIERESGPQPTTLVYATTAREIKKERDREWKMEAKTKRKRERKAFNQPTNLVYTTTKPQEKERKKAYCSQHNSLSQSSLTFYSL